MFLCVLQILFFPLEMVSSIKNGLCETKHSPAWAMANMFPMWPQDSCFSLVVAGVGGLPFRWHDASLPQWSLQTGKMDLWNSETSYFHPGTLSFSFSFLKFLTTLWPCPLLSITKGLFLQKWQAFYESKIKMRASLVENNRLCDPRSPSSCCSMEGK